MNEIVNTKRAEKKNDLLIFPDEDFDQTTYPFIMMNSYKWEFFNRYELAPKHNKEVSKTIVLPLPESGIQESYQHQWQEKEGILNIEGGVFSRAVSALNKRLGITDFLSDIAGSQTGLLMNDHASLTYNGHGFRQFEFSFNLIPKSERESILIEQIIQAFKKESLPEYEGIGNKYIFGYPNFWKFEVISFPYGTILKSVECVVENFTTNYNPSSYMKIFKTGRPNQINISVTFKELRKIQKKDVLDYNKADGVYDKGNVAILKPNKR